MSSISRRMCERLVDAKPGTAISDVRQTLHLAEHMNETSATPWPKEIGEPHKETRLSLFENQDRKRSLRSPSKEPPTKHWSNYA